MDYPPKLLELVKENIKSYPNFPKKGVIFRDLFSVLGNPESSEAVFDLFLFHCKQNCSNIQAICGIETKGFIFGPYLASHLKIPFVAIRKKGKLPGKVKSVSYTLEYGSEVMEIQCDALPPNTNVLLIDDLLATGGTLNAACKLIHSIGSKVDHCVVIIELEDLKGREKVPTKVSSFLKL